MGLEAAGTVEKLGPGATKWKIGDRVMALVGGRFIWAPSFIIFINALMHDLIEFLIMNHRYITVCNIVYIYIFTAIIVFNYRIASKSALV